MKKFFHFPSTLFKIGILLVKNATVKLVKNVPDIIKLLFYNLKIKLINIIIIENLVSF